MVPQQLPSYIPYFPASFGAGALWASIWPRPVHLQDLAAHSSAERPGAPQSSSSWDMVSTHTWGCPLWIALCVDTLSQQQSLRVWDVYLAVCRVCSPHRQQWQTDGVWVSWCEAAAVTDERLWCCLARRRNLFQMVPLQANCLPQVWGSLAACMCVGWLSLNF